MSTTRTFDVITVGGGPAGMIASIEAAKRGLSVLLCEKNGRCGKKLNITGKGRCNITNLCSREEFLENVLSNSRFMYAPLSALSPEDTVEYFESLGVKTKQERGKRIFPVSDRASDVTDALVNECRRLGVSFSSGKVTKILTENGSCTGVECGGEVIFADSVIIATGGASYPRTGSDGNGYRLAAQLGHSIVTPEGSLVPLVSNDSLCPECMGLSLKNVGVTLVDGKDKAVFCDQGEMLFTHFGLSGPLVLSASAYVRSAAPYKIVIDLKPALDLQTLDKRLVRDFSENSNRDLKNGFSQLLPSKLIAPFVKKLGIPPETKLHSLKKEQRLEIAKLLKALTVDIRGKRPIEEAIVTSGGVDCREVSPKTMESKLVRGVYFAGEILDIDAYTGGFNLQIAFSTGFVAGRSC